MVKTLLLIILFLLSGYSHAASYNDKQIDVSQLDNNIQLSRYYDYLDDAEKLTPEQALNLSDWTAASAEKSTNLKKSGFWLKVKLVNTGSKDIELVYIQENPNLSQLSLFIARKNDIALAYEVGANKRFSERPIQHRQFILPITVKAGESFIILAHAIGGSNDHIHRSFLSHSDHYFQSINLEHIWEIFYFGILFVMIIYNAFIYFITREKAYLFYSAFVASTMLLFLSISGYAFQLFWPNTPKLNPDILLMAMGFMQCFAGRFSIEFLQLRKNFPIIAKIIDYLSITVIAELALVTILPEERTTLFVRLLIVNATLIYFLSWFAGILTLKTKNDIASRVYVVAWTTFIFINIVVSIHEAITPILHIQPYTAAQIAHTIEVILLSIALASRINHLSTLETITKAKADAQNKFLARMSHEIRNPMNGIVGMSDLLSRRIHDETDKHHINIIHQSAKALERIINDILDYSKIESGKLELRQENFSIIELVEGVCGLFELQCYQKDLDLSYKVSKETPNIVTGDAQRIRQILINLVSNAVKYTHHGNIKLSVRTYGDSTVFDVSDTGEGIHADDIDRLFEPFEQAKSNNLGRESSTGLGLSISRELVNLMGGEINVQSTLGTGSRFWFSVLLIETNNSATTSLTEPSAQAIEALPTMDILIAEDNSINKVVIDSIMRTLNMNITIVSNGLEAVGYFKSSHREIDLIFMDCEMPTLNGFKATEIIRQYENDNKLTRTSIIALTAHTWHEELQHCYSSGMDDLLLKPTTRAAVEACLQKHCNKLTPSVESTVTA